MVIIKGCEVGAEICEILGLENKEVKSVNISFPADAAVELTAVMLPSEKEMKEVFEVIKRYELREVLEK